MISGQLFTCPEKHVPLNNIATIIIPGILLIACFCGSEVAMKPLTLKLLQYGEVPTYLFRKSSMYLYSQLLYAYYSLWDNSSLRLI